MYTKKGFKTKTGKYRPEFAEKAYKLSLLGVTEKMLTVVFEVNQTTIDYWKQNQPEFLKALQKGRTEADANVAYALYQRAVGYSCPDTHITTAYNQETKRTEVIQTPITKHYPPDSYAALKWLNIRQRELWSDITKVEHTIKGQIDIQYLDQLTNEKEFTDEDLQALLKLGLKKAQKEQMVSQN